MLTESRLCAFIAEHTLPFSISQPLAKATNIMRQGLGFYISQLLIDHLKKTKFSSIPDETTDVSTEKQLAICVFYFDYEKCEVAVSFFDIVAVEKCDAESLYAARKKYFEEKKISLENIIGFSSDTWSVMFGAKKGVMSLMRADLPHVVFVRCSYYMIHLCVSHTSIPQAVSFLRGSFQKCVFIFQ